MTRDITTSAPRRERAGRVRTTVSSICSAIVAAALLAMTQPSTALADPGAPTVADVSISTTQAVSELEHVETLIELTTFPEGGSPSIDAATALASGVTQPIIDEFQSGLAAGSTTAMRLACVGDTSVAGSGSGGKLLLGSCQVNVVVGLLAGGATVAGIAGAILAFFPPTAPAGLVTAIVSGLVGLGSVGLAVCNAAGAGVRLEWVGVLTCQSQ